MVYQVNHQPQKFYVLPSHKRATFLEVDQLWWVSLGRFLVETNASIFFFVLYDFLTAKSFYLSEKAIRTCTAWYRKCTNISIYLYCRKPIEKVICSFFVSVRNENTILMLVFCSYVHVKKTGTLGECFT